MTEKEYIARWKKVQDNVANARKEKFNIIKELMLEGMTYTAIGKMFGVSEQYISAFYKDNSKIAK